MKSSRVLVINDDGVGSPLLLHFLDAISREPWCRELRVVVPATEQSWVAQCITRFRELQAEPYSFGKHSGFLVNGTAADCSTLGIQNLYPDKPDLVLSGVNMGWNAALPFFMSSGTIGGAAEAFLTKVPALALSVFLPDDVYRAYSSHNEQAMEQHLPRWPIIAASATKVCRLLLTSEFWLEADIFSVNLPWDVTPESKMVLTHLEEAHFEKLFIDSESGPLRFRHKLQGVFFESPRKYGFTPHPGTADVHALDSGLISVTPIRYTFTAQVSENFRAKIERS